MQVIMNDETKAAIELLKAWCKDNATVYGGAFSEHRTAIETVCAAAERGEADTKRLVEILQTILDSVDYTRGNCSSTNMVGAILPKVLIDKGREAIDAARRGEKGEAK